MEMAAQSVGQYLANENPVIGRIDWTALFPPLLNCSNQSYDFVCENRSLWIANIQSVIKEFAGRKTERNRITRCCPIAVFNILADEFSASE